MFVFWEIDEGYEVFVAGDDQREWTLYVQKCRRATASQVWLEPKKAEEWVLAQLKAQGSPCGPRSEKWCL